MECCHLQEVVGREVGIRSRAMAALREFLRHDGEALMEYALHSGRIGGAMSMAAAGFAPAAIQREERWKSNVFMVNVRAQ